MATFRTFSEQTLYSGSEYANPKGGQTIKEDLRDWIENVSAVQRPLLARFRKTRLTSVYPEWLEDTLPARGTNAWAEGTDHTAQDLTTASRSSNSVQTFAHFGQLSDTQVTIEHAGGDALLYQEGKSVKKVLNDVEHAIHRGTMITGSSAAPARQMAGMLNIVSTNSTSSSGTTCREDVFNDFIQVFVDGATDVFPRMCTVNSYLKRTISQYNTAVTRNIDADARTQMLVVNRYATDFGDMDVFYAQDQLASASKTTSGNSLLICDDRFFELGFLKSLVSEEFARVGLSRKYGVSTELTLIHRSEKAGSVATDLVGYIPAAT